MNKKTLIIIIAVVVVVAIIIYLLYKKHLVVHTTTTSPTTTSTTTTSPTTTSPTTTQTSTSSTSPVYSGYIVKNTCGEQLNFVIPNYNGTTLYWGVAPGATLNLSIFNNPSVFTNAYFIGYTIVNFTPQQVIIPITINGNVVEPSFCPPIVAPPTSTSSTSSSAITAYIIQNTCKVPLEFILPNYYGSTLNISLIAGQMYTLYLPSQSLLNNAYFLYGSQQIPAQIASCTPVSSVIPTSESNCTVVPAYCPSIS